MPKTGSHVVSNVEGDLYLAAATQMRLSGDPAAVRSVQAAVAMIPGVQQVLYTPGLSDKSPDPIVRAAARELRRRIDPDPLMKYLLFVALGLFVFLVWLVYKGQP